MAATFRSPFSSMEPSPIHRVSVADQVAGILRQRILSGELRPGVALPEIPVAVSLGVSRNTMREAVRILALEGLLKRNIHRGVRVVQLSRKDIQEIYDLRRMVEVQSILSAKRRSPELMQELETAVNGYEKAVRARDWLQAVNWDLQFHTLLIRLRGNKRLETFYQKVIGELRTGMVLVDSSHDDPGALVPMHRKLYQLLQADKLKQCAEVLLQHLDDSESRFGGIMAGEVQATRVKGTGGSNGKAVKTRARNSRAAASN